VDISANAARHRGRPAWLGPPALRRQSRHIEAGRPWSGPWTSRRGILVSVAAFAVTVVTGCGAPAGQLEPNHPPRCSNLLFLGVRGSGEDQSHQLAMGTTVYPIYSALRSADRRVVGYGWPFDAVRPAFVQLTRDANAFIHFLNRRARRCPAERVVLAGYSAGALIVGDALQSAALAAAAEDRVAAAVLLADPEFNPADTRTAAGTFDPRYGGSPRRLPYPAPLASRIRSYCRRQDIVCQRDDRAAGKIQHGNYAPQQTCRAINFIESAADLRRTKC
jgi:Cutinase